MAVFNSRGKQKEGESKARDAFSLTERRLQKEEKPKTGWKGKGKGEEKKRS